MSAGVFWRAGATAEAEPKDISSRAEKVTPFVGWSPERFATEQIRNLVRRVFSQSVMPAVRQVVFSGVEPEADALDLCRRVGEVLAQERLGDVVVVGNRLPLRSDADDDQHRPESLRDAGALNLREIATRLRGNLWAVPFTARGKTAGTASLQRYLSEIRREFEYSLIAAASCGESQEAISSAQFADGMILVLSARFTRRVAALRVRDAVEDANVRLLGTVLRDREFPIPEQLYRRL